jgi:hypothetical protein
MKRIKVDFSESFQSVVKRLLSVPKNDRVNGEKRLAMEKKYILDPEFETAVRFLYDAAHDRDAKTHLGLIPRPRPAAEFLKETPFYIETQIDFFIQAMARIIAHASDNSNGTDAMANIDPTPELQPGLEQPATDAPIDFFPNSFLRSERPHLNGLMLPPHYD